MIKSGEEILADIDRTLDQLIHNVTILRQVSECEAFANEYALLHKTQQSLTARVLHMEHLLDETGQLGLPDTTLVHDAIQKKIARYKRLNNEMIEGISQRFKQQRKVSLGAARSDTVEATKPARRHKTPKIGRNRKHVGPR